MSRCAAIDVAVRMQLLADNKTINFANLFGPDRPAAGAVPAAAGYDYSEPAMLRFLLGVADRLRRDEPAQEFPWRMANVPQCLASDHLMLISLIEDLIRTET